MMQSGIDEVFLGWTFKNKKSVQGSHQPELTMGSWIHDGFLDSRWVPGFTMGSWIHGRFLDSRWVPGFTIGSWIHDGFLDSWWFPGFTMTLPAWPTGRERLQPHSRSLRLQPHLYTFSWTYFPKVWFLTRLRKQATACSESHPDRHEDVALRKYCTKSVVLNSWQSQHPSPSEDQLHPNWNIWPYNFDNTHLDSKLAKRLQCGTLYRSLTGKP